MKLQAIFCDDNFRIKRFRQKAFHLWQSFQFSYRNIISFKNPFWLKYGLQGFYQSRLPYINSQSQGLDHEIIIELINDQLRQAVCFAKNKPAILNITNLLAISPALF